MGKVSVFKPQLPIEKIKRLAEVERIYKDIKQERDNLRFDLLNVTQALDVYTLKTGAYTLSRAKRITPQVVDFKTLKASLDKANIPYDVVEVFAPHMMATFKQAISENIELDGLESLVTEYITIRVKEDK